MTEGLSTEHERSLCEASGISLEVVRSRGYPSATSKADVRRLEFSARQCVTPALLIPVWGVTGEIATYQLRPDSPRVNRGKAVKYETPSGTTMALDVHPLARPLLVDPKVPLFITEGIKKGDALVSRDCCAIALLGVWNWRGTNDAGGKTLLADWEHVALNGRRVYVVFDSDVMTKPAVHAALVRLGAVLKRRGAI